MNLSCYAVSRTLTTLFLSIIFCLPSFATPPNIGLLKKEIRHYHDSGQYEKELTKKIKEAQEYILSQADYYQSHKSHKQLALVLDIDETSLSNYNKIAMRDFGASYEQIHKEIMAADAPAIKPMLDLYNNALKHHIKVFFVTGRTDSELQATKTNLSKAGYSKWAGIYVRPTEYKKDSIIPFKSEARAKIAKKGYIILASIGDQNSDILGGYAKKGFKLPNPFYYIR